MGNETYMGIYYEKIDYMGFTWGFIWGMAGRQIWQKLAWGSRTIKSITTLFAEKDPPPPGGVSSRMSHHKCREGMKIGHENLIIMPKA